MIPALSIMHFITVLPGKVCLRFRLKYFLNKQNEGELQI